MSSQAIIFTCEGQTSFAYKMNHLSISRSVCKFLPKEWNIVYIHFHEVIRIPNHKPIIDTTIIYTCNSKVLHTTVRYVTIEYGDDMQIEKVIQEHKQQS